MQVFVPVSESLKRKLNPGGEQEQPWRDVVVYPIDKIGTFIREFTALQSIQQNTNSLYLLDPRQMLY